MFQGNRRRFLGVAAAAGTLAVSRAVHGQTPASDRVLKLAVIGMGGYGMADTKAALKAGGVEIVAVCDVDSAHLEAAATEIDKLQGRRPATFKLYEEMLDKAEADAAIIATPPQWHALQAIACVERGLDVYCEKPLAYDVREGRAMIQAVRKSGRTVQIGFQRRQSAAFQQVAEFIRAGKAGRIVQVDTQIHYRAGTPDATPQDPPPSLDWDLWCGPGPKIPYSPAVGHRSWRLEKTSGHGHLVDWGIHNIDSVRMILGLATPKQITAAGGLYQYAGKITTPDTLTVHFEFEQMPVVWRHRLWGATEYDAAVSNGIFFYGEEATIFASDRKWVVIPRNASDKREEFDAPADLGTLHMANFLDAVRSGSPLACPIEDGFQSTATVQLGMIAYESNSVVQWDEAKEQIPGNPAAAALLKRDYRLPYVHPYQTA
jgi:predicted dehydrogenase